jgi:hypothetical protein
MSDYTPEQQKAYDEEMTRLDAEAAKATTGSEQAEATTTPAPVVNDQAATTPPPAAATGETDSEVAKRLASVEKALADTQRWAHQNAAEVKRLKKEAEERERAAARPAILDDNPGLEDAIKHVSGAAPVAANSQENNWLETVNGVLPDLENLLETSPDFRALAQQKRTEMGASWNDPIAAARELGQLQAQYQSKQATASAVEAARKDFALRQKKSTAMQVPGGGGSKTVTDTSEVDRINNMSDAEFAAMRNKTLGF